MAEADDKQQPRLTADEIAEALRELGLSQRAASEELWLEGEWKERSVRRWLRGERPISGPAARALTLLLTLKRAGLWEPQQRPRRGPKPKDEHL